MPALDGVLELDGQVVAQVVEAELGVGAVGDVAGVGATPLVDGMFAWMTPTLMPSAS
jgi:hypothetical protein